MFEVLLPKPEDNRETLNYYFIVKLGIHNEAFCGVLTSECLYIFQNVKVFCSLKFRQKASLGKPVKLKSSTFENHNFPFL